MLARIHVNQHVIRANKKKKTHLEPPFTIKTYNRNIKGYCISITGPSQLVYSPDKPLGCGAVAWIETDSDNIVVDMKTI